MSQVDQARSDVTEKCPTCQGADGDHYPNCPERPALETNQSGEALPGGLGPVSQDLSQEEIQEHFDTADELFGGKKFEDGAVVSDEREPAEATEEIGLSDAIAKSEEEPPTPEEQLSHAKLPPSAEMLVGNELLWLVARTCHEVNRAYCVGVTSDHSHQPWDIAPEWQRESCYEGVLKHYHNAEFTPEDSHASWMAKKIEDGWSFGNLKDETAKTHPNIVPYHTLHIHERTKDAIFSAICKSMLGGVR